MKFIRPRGGMTMHVRTTLDCLFDSPGPPGGHRGPGQCGSVRAVRAGPLLSFHLYRPFVESTKPHLKSVAGYTAPAWRKETT